MDAERPHQYLYYDTPASCWDQALPIGNGRLGCMVHGRTSTEFLQLNEDSVWYGGPQNRTPRSAKHLPTLRRLIREGRHREAEQLVRDEFFATPASMRHYEPLGNLYLDFGLRQDDTISDYQRWLDIGEAIATTSYNVNGTTVRREVLASYPDNVILLHVVASSTIEFRISLNRRGENEWDTNEFLDSVRAELVEDRTARVVMHATPGGLDSNHLCCVAGVMCAPDHGSVKVFGATAVVNSSECIIAVGAQTTYRHSDPEAAATDDVSKALQYSWKQLHARHVKDYQALFGRTSLRLWPDASHVATDKRIAERNDEDAGLVALYHNYGRYLLISSSRDGVKAMPANLQGIWNPSFSPPWGSKYTININIQMNYWPAASCNLIECALPLVDLLERMAERGKRTAQLMYGCSGWCGHHNTDIWADTDPQDTWMPATLWPLGGLWLCVDLVKLLQFRYDRQLHERLFPILEGCIEFLEDFLLRSADGAHLVTAPSLSPENTFVSESGELGIFCEGSAIDMTIIESAFDVFLWSTDILGRETPLRRGVEEMKSQIPTLQINTDGLIQEWGMNDYEESEPGHRHVSHLFGLYPGDSINVRRTPELCAAAKRVLARRAAHGGGHTGWSRAWLLNMHARLLDAEGCGDHLELLLKKSTLPNLLDNHPPFQIDGNFGGCAGIIECLLQSYVDTVPTSHGKPVVTILLLPSVPRTWSKGRMSGICVRAGWLVSVQWDNGHIKDPVCLEATQTDHIRANVVYPDGYTVSVEGLGRHDISR